MLVETFECQETVDENIELSEEAIALIESLGLKGQKSLLSKPDKGNLSRCPYRVMTAEEEFVYGVLCPKKTELEKYSGSPIPLRVLQVAVHANSLGIFNKLYVWDKLSAAVKDPVLVARKPDPERLWTENTFILARWGDVLDTFHTLRQQALQMKRMQIAAKLASVTSKAQMLIKNLESLEESELIENGPDWVPTF